jgi:hypothetical protein
VWSYSTCNALPCHVLVIDCIWLPQARSSFLFGTYKQLRQNSAAFGQYEIQYTQRQVMKHKINLLIILAVYFCIHGARGDVVIEALSYKSAGREFDSRWCHWNFSVI